MTHSRRGKTPPDQMSPPDRPRSAASVQTTGRAKIREIRRFILDNKSAVGRMVKATFLIKTLEEAENLATILAVQSPRPERVAAGIWELLSNAIEHGSLEISFEEKTALLLAGRFREEVEERLTIPPYRDRLVEVTFERTSTSVRYRICDEGKGFDHQTFINADMEHDLPNGRGIPIALRFGFDTVVYLGKGNCVEATVNL